MTKYSDSKMIVHIQNLFPICRSITGEGIRKTLNYFESFNPEFKRIKFKTGEKVFDWEIPQEWNVKNAYLKHIKTGEIFAEFEKNNLHLMGYSEPKNCELDFEELSSKIYTLRNKPEWIPYVTSYYKKDWGFCMKDSIKSKMKSGKYKVFIDSSFKKGNLELSHALIKGKSKKEILFSSYVCHPSMANNELSGPVLLNAILDYIKTNFRKTKYSYRFIMQPETIGSIAYLSKYHKYLCKNVICGFNLSCVGDNRAYSLVHTPYENTLADYALSAALKGLVNVKEYSFLSRGSDERQYCSPGIRLPVCTFSRSLFGQYPEYHSSADNLDVVNQEGLEGSLDVFKTIIEAFETSLYPKIRVKCEPQLGKRGIYPNTSFFEENKIDPVKARMNFITYCDGEKSIFEVSEKINLDLKSTIKEAKLIKKHNLLY